MSCESGSASGSSPLSISLSLSGTPTQVLIQGAYRHTGSISGFSSGAWDGVNQNETDLANQGGGTTSQSYAVAGDIATVHNPFNGSIQGHVQISAVSSTGFTLTGDTTDFQAFIYTACDNSGSGGGGGGGGGIFNTPAQEIFASSTMGESGIAQYNIVDDPTVDFFMGVLTFIICAWFVVFLFKRR